MNVKERCKIIRAMELLTKTVNDELVFEEWLTDGAADGDIGEDTTDDELDYYTDDEAFADLMDTFLDVIRHT